MLRKLMSLLLLFAFITVSYAGEANKDYIRFSNVGKKVEKAFDELDMKLTNTKVRLLTSNVESWNARWKMISDAKVSIDTIYFNIMEDVYGKAFIGLLLKKIREGVKVRLMIDAIGSMYFQKNFRGGLDFLQELVEAGGEVRIFNPPFKLKNLPKLPFKLKYWVSSNHDKILIVDGKLAVTGGRNIAKDYFAHVEDMESAWRDTDVVMEGTEICKSMQEAFELEFEGSDHYKVKKELFGNWDSKYYELILAQKAMNRWMLGNGLYTKSATMKKNPSIYNEELKQFKHSQCLSSYQMFHGDRTAPIKIIDKTGLAMGKNDITDSIIKMIDATEKELIIQNPYVILSDRAKAALQRANDRGVRIILHTNSPVSTDSLFTQAFFINDWKDLLKNMPNLEIWAFVGKRKLHSKVFIFDRKVCTIGTYNLDNLSENINSEVLACIKSPTFSMRSALKVMEDVKESKQYTIQLTRDGEPVELFGPAALAKGKIKVILEVLRRMKFMKSLI